MKKTNEFTKSMRLGALVLFDSMFPLNDAEFRKLLITPDNSHFLLFTKEDEPVPRYKWFFL